MISFRQKECKIPAVKGDFQTGFQDAPGVSGPLRGWEGRLKPVMLPQAQSPQAQQLCVSLFSRYFQFSVKSNPLQFMHEETATQKSWASCLGSHGLLVKDLRLELKYPNMDHLLSTMWLWLYKEEHMFSTNCFIVVTDPHRITQISLHSTFPQTSWLYFKKEALFKKCHLEASRKHLS